MRAWIRVITLVLIFALLATPIVALASSIDTAKWYSVITVSNNSTEADDVFTTFPLSTQNLIDSNFLSENLTDCAMHDPSGADTAFMPSVNATYPWCLYVDYVGEDAFKNYLLYTGGNADMGGKIRYFPAASGMTASDNATLELSDNFTIEMAGWIDTDSGVSKNLVYKKGAFRTYVSETVSENITAAILNWGGVQTDTLRPDGHDTCAIPGETGAACPDHYLNVDEAGAGDNGTTTVESNDDAATYTDWYSLSTTSANSTANITAVTVYIKGDRSFTGWFKSGLKLNSDTTYGAVRTPVGWTLYSDALARPGGGAWQYSDLDDLLVGIQLNASAGGGHFAKVTQVYVVISFEPANEVTTVTATDVESGEHTVRVTYLPNLLTNSSFEIGDPPDDWTLSGANATVSRSSVQAKIGTYSANLTRNGADCHIFQEVSDYAHYAERQVTLGMWAYATVANRVRIRLTDGVAAPYSSYHSGVAGWEWLTVSLLFDSSPTQLKVLAYVQAGDTTAYFDGAIVVEGDSIPDYNTFRIFIDDVEEDQVYTEVEVPDNINDWTFVENYSMPYIEYLKIWKSEIE